MPEVKRAYMIFYPPWTVSCDDFSACWIGPYDSLRAAKEDAKWERSGDTRPYHIFRMTEVE